MANEKYLMMAENPTGTGSLSLNRLADTVVGNYSSATGYDTTASGDNSHAEGNKTTASGASSHAEGTSCTASDSGDHAEGHMTKSSGLYGSHSEGNQTNASGRYGSHAEGWFTVASSDASHAEGFRATASGRYSHAEGYGTTASNYASHAEGQWTTASGNSSHAEGYSTTASGNDSHAEGNRSRAIGSSSHAEGGLSNPTKLGTATITAINNKILTIDGFTDYSSIMIGYSFIDSNKGHEIITAYNADANTITLSNSIADLTTGTEITIYSEGINIASGNSSHAEGYSTTASGSGSHAENHHTIASGENSHAEGYNTTASGTRSHAEGYNTTASGDECHAEGFATTASGITCHAEGDSTVASGEICHAEGANTIASGLECHAEGINTLSCGEGSHAEGYYTVASGFYSHAEGGTSSLASLGTATVTSIDDSRRTLVVSGFSNYSSIVSNRTVGVCRESNCAVLISGYQESSNYLNLSIPASSLLLVGDELELYTYMPIALGDYSHSEGRKSVAGNESAHAEGYNTLALGVASHAEGDSTTASGKDSHAEGYKTTASGDHSHAEGYNTVASGSYSHAEGYAGSIKSTISVKVLTSSEKANIKAITGKFFSYCATSGSLSNSAGHRIYSDSSYKTWVATIKETKYVTSSTLTGACFNTEYNDELTDGVTYYVRRSGGALGTSSHAEGYDTVASGSRSHAEGDSTTASGEYAHAEGYQTTASGPYSHAEGLRATAFGNGSHAEGIDTTASGERTHAEGSGTVASGDYSHAEGNKTAASGSRSHAEGYNTVASGSYSHAEGDSTTASGSDSHAEGYKTTASGDHSHAEGYNTVASGSYSHAEGDSTTASNYASHASGKYNAAMTTGGSLSNTTGTAFVIGNGTKSSALSNAFSVQFNGVVKAKSTITASTTADYAEFFEWIDSNAENEDRVGYFVTLDGDKIRIATNEDEYILGIVSGEPFVLGNGDCDTWNGMYLKDEFRRTIYEPAPKVIEVEDKETITEEYIDKESGETKTREVEVVVGTHYEEVEGEYEGTRPKLNPEYDPEQAYVSRFDRKEWSPVGMLGVLAVRHDGTAQVNGYVTVNQEGIATACERKDNNSYRVIKSNSEGVVEVVFR